MEKEEVTWNTELFRTTRLVVETSFWQDEALGISWCPDSSVVAVEVTQGGRGSPDCFQKVVSKLFKTQLCSRG